MIGSLCCCCCTETDFGFGATVYRQGSEDFYKPRIVLSLIDKKNNTYHPVSRVVDGSFSYSSFTGITYDYEICLLSYLPDLTYEMLSCGLYRDIFNFDDTFDDILNETLNYKSYFLSNGDSSSFDSGHITTCRTYIIDGTYYALAYASASVSYNILELEDYRNYFKDVILNPSAYSWYSIPS